MTGITSKIVIPVTTENLKREADLILAGADNALTIRCQSEKECLAFEALMQEYYPDIKIYCSWIVRGEDAYPGGEA